MYTGCTESSIYMIYSFCRVSKLFMIKRRKFKYMSVFDVNNDQNPMYLYVVRQKLFTFSCPNSICRIMSSDFQTICYQYLSNYGCEVSSKSQKF